MCEFMSVSAVCIYMCACECLRGVCVGAFVRMYAARVPLFAPFYSVRVCTDCRNEGANSPDYARRIGS